MKPNVLILCTGNACRSHMAEGILRARAGDLFEVHSAGARPAGYVHALAVEVMREIGIEISGHRSKSSDEFLDAGIDTVITVCDNANELCPRFPAQKHRYHWSFADPSRAEGDDAAVAAAFRDARDRIRMVFEAFADGYRQALARETAHASDA